MKRLFYFLVLVLIFLTSTFTNSFAQLPWTKDTNNPVMSGGAIGAWDRHVFWPSVLYNPDSSRYEMWFSAAAQAGVRPYNIGFATSLDGITWTSLDTAVLKPDAGSWDQSTTEGATVIRENGQYKMWYLGWSPSNPDGGFGYATSSNGITWIKHSINPVMTPSSAIWEAGGFGSCSVLPVPGGYKMWYDGYTADFSNSNIGLATSPDGIAWTLDSLNNPVLTTGISGTWDDGNLELPRVSFINNLYHIWYTGMRPGETLPWHMGWATSIDGIQWNKYNDPTTTSSLYSASDPVLGSTSGQWDGTHFLSGSVLLEGDSLLRMWYSGSRSPTSTNLFRIGHATAPFTAPLALHVPADYATIQSAIDAATEGNLVLVADGTYQENINFKGKAITVASHFYIDGDTTHIDSTIIEGSNPSNADSGSVVYFISGEDTNSVLIGFTISGGSGTLGSNNNRDGGGIYCLSGATIKNNKIINNRINFTGYATGGGILAGFWTPDYIHIEHNVISNNTVESLQMWGGGIWFGVNGRIIGNKIENNAIIAESGWAVGAGISCQAPDTGNHAVQIADNIIRNNLCENNSTTSGATGGALDLFYTDLIFENNFISENTVSSPYNCYGPAVRLVFTQNAELKNNKFYYNEGMGNNSIYSGALFLVSTSGTLVNNNEILGNSGTWGGGIYVNNSNPLIQNNLIVNNNATYGGGIRIYTTTDELNDDGLDEVIVYKGFHNTFSGKTKIFNSGSSPIKLLSQPQIINNTIKGNIAISLGGGIYSTNSQTTILNSILWGNTAATGSQIQNSSGTIEVNYCDVEGGWSGIGNIDADPLFADTLDFHLSDSSICIGSGIDSIQIGGTWYYAPQIDIEGNPRPNPAGSMPDIGAQESPYANPTGIISEDSDYLPKTFALKQNYPNPFNPTTNIEFSIPNSEFVTLKIYNMLGQEVVALVDQKLTPAKYKYIWDAGSLASAVYLYKLKAGNFIETKKLILLK